MLFCFSDVEQPTLHGIKEDNLGNRLLKSMGWREGQGLGRSNQGIIDPIKSRRRAEGAGLGAEIVDEEVGGRRLTYQEAAKARLRQKYYEDDTR